MQWVAFYEDGTQLSQYAPDGSTSSSEQIDRSKLVAFALLDDNLDEVLRLQFEQNQKLIYRMRTEIAPGVGKRVWHLIGWQETIGHAIVQEIAGVFTHPNGKHQIEFVHGFEHGHEWAYPLELVQCEIDDGIVMPPTPQTAEIYQTADTAKA